MSVLLPDVGNTRSSGQTAFRPTPILTGGDASRILKSLDEVPLHRPHIVLQVLAHMLESR